IWVLSRPNLVSTPFCAISQVSTGQYSSWTKYLLAFVLPKPAGGDPITPTGHRIGFPPARSLAEDCRLRRSRVAPKSWISWLQWALYTKPERYRVTPLPWQPAMPH